MKNYFTTARITKIAMLSALACVLMMLEFRLPFLPPFYKLDFSEIVVLIGGFAMGPLAAVLIEGFKVVLNLIFSPTETLFVGEIANFLIGCSFTFTAALYYQKHKTKKSALYAMILGTVVMCVVGAIMNAFILLPVYSYFYNMPLDALIDMGTAVNASITSLETFVIFATTPLNLIKGVLNCILVMIIYKRVSPLLKS